MYEEYFGLTAAPFSIAPDPQYLYMSNRHREALAHLLYGIENNGFILLTGEVGTGKTTVCRCLLEQLPENVDTAFIINPKVNAHELLASICDDLRITYPADATPKILVDRLNTYLVSTLESGRRTLLIIDEAQNLSVEVLEQLRLLTNLETNRRKLLQIILLGQPELLETLSKQSLRQLSQRITARFHLGALNKKEVNDYIAHRLSVSGARGNFFKHSAMDRIYKLSNGIPRVINLICDRCLLGAYAENRAIVTPRIVKKAAREILLSGNAEQPIGSDYSKSSTTDWRLPTAIAASIVGVAITVSMLLPTQVSYNSSVETSAEKAASTMSIVPYADHDSTLIPISETVGHTSKKMAFDDLFALWGIYIEDQITDPCDTIQSIGLACLEEAGGLRKIHALNRPVILQLHDSQWITISQLSDNTATLLAREREYQISRNELAAAFDGSFTVVWRMPPGYQTPTTLGDNGADVDWLVYQLAIFEQRTPDQTTGFTFDESVVQQVKHFQESVNVPANGVVDPTSWIHINSIEGVNIPFLTGDAG
ncbi:MAG TPA: hypothetical protein DCM54_08975 [Gammaproteobacteria bacterium]|nr:hypothetical protein [Gammaproteobacteria bacterium]|tara:strand:- start:566 stop:2185 length:1620 start_codon:yes stop_codon:yes gene_type:complete